MVLLFIIKNIELTPMIKTNTMIKTMIKGPNGYIGVQWPLWSQLWNFK